jgi:endonuclease/exonuclease/phosphatase family metal-dependent hydrolase
MLNFSGRTHKDLDTIANIIVSEQFDVIALQEVLSYEALIMILRRLPRYWEGKWDQPRSNKAELEYVDAKDADGKPSTQNTRRSTNTAKGYAFLWNTRRLRECSKTGPLIFEQIKSGALVRNPYYGRFTPAGLPGGSFFEIRLINVHLCSPAEGKEARVKEFALMTDEIYSRINKKRYGDNMPSYTVILGDYNMSLKWCEEYTGAGENQIIATEQEDKTTLKKASSSLGNNEISVTKKLNPYKIATGITRTLGKIIPPTNISFIDSRLHKITQSELLEAPSGDDEFFANDYDHFSYDGIRLAELFMRCERVNAVKKYSKNDFSTYQKEISDHVPILMELEINSGY